jgi:hypothetical protein
MIASSLPETCTGMTALSKGLTRSDHVNTERISKVTACETHTRMKPPAAPTAKVSQRLPPGSSRVVAAVRTSWPLRSLS